MAAVATSYTFDFVIRNLPKGTSRILEIGCGAGELAARLIAEGFEVVALDGAQECVDQARTLGVEARLLEWPAQLTETFDAVLFTRSLHHVHELEDAISAAAGALRPYGRIIVEDFRAEGGTERSTDRFRRVVKSLHTAGAFRFDFDLEQTLAKTETTDHD